MSELVRTFLSLKVIMEEKETSSRNRKNPTLDDLATVTLTIPDPLLSPESSGWPNLLE